MTYQDLNACVVTTNGCQDDLSGLKCALNALHLTGISRISGSLKNKKSRPGARDTEPAEGVA